MQNTMTLEIITPSGSVVHNDIQYVNVPAFDGERGFLCNHADFIGSLTKGTVMFRSKGKDSSCFIEGGLVMVQENIVSILTEAVDEVK
ncbi:MAG: hypothetical protein ACRCV3_00850 [Desulfovibrionaceae bacterium]